MKITKEMLKSKSPCKGGYIWFLEKYGNKAKVSYETLIKDSPREYRGWIKEEFYIEPDISPKYRGKFYIGQKVYFQYFDLGCWRKVTIHRICENRSGFHAEVDPVREEWPRTPHCVQIEDLFSSFDDLKDHWIRKIRAMTEERELCTTKR